MSAETKPVDVYIMGKEYRVGCKAGEEKELTAAAGYLDEKMREIRQAGKVIGTERIAVTAALNIAHELLSLQDGGNRVENEELKKRIRTMRERIEGALNDSAQLEL